MCTVLFRTYFQPPPPPALSLSLFTKREKWEIGSALHLSTSKMSVWWHSINILHRFSLSSTHPSNKSQVSKGKGQPHSGQKLEVVTYSPRICKEKKWPKISSIISSYTHHTHRSKVSLKLLEGQLLESARVRDKVQLYSNLFKATRGFHSLRI